MATSHQVCFERLISFSKDDSSSFFQIDVVRKVCSLVRSTDGKEGSANLSQSEEIDDDIEIIPSNNLQDDCAQINLNECHEQSNTVSSLFPFFSSTKSFFFFRFLANKEIIVTGNRNSSKKKRGTSFSEL